MRVTIEGHDGGGSIEPAALLALPVHSRIQIFMRMGISQPSKRAEIVSRRLQTEATIASRRLTLHSTPGDITVEQAAGRLHSTCFTATGNIMSNRGRSTVP